MAFLVAFAADERHSADECSVAKTLAFPALNSGAVLHRVTFYITMTAGEVPFFLFIVRADIRLVSNCVDGVPT
jgi:hypothetical protein